MTLDPCFHLLNIGITGRYNHAQVMLGAGDGTQGFLACQSSSLSTQRQPSLGLCLLEKHKLQDLCPVPLLFSLLPGFLSCEFGQTLAGKDRSPRAQVSLPLSCPDDWFKIL